MEDSKVEETVKPGQIVFSELLSSICLQQTFLVVFHIVLLNVEIDFADTRGGVVNTEGSCVIETWLIDLVSLQIVEIDGPKASEHIQFLVN